MLRAIHRSAAQLDRLARLERSIAGSEEMFMQRGADIALTLGPWTLDRRSA
jgi:hypothetical protein